MIALVGQLNIVGFFAKFILRDIYHWKEPINRNIEVHNQIFKLYFIGKNSKYEIKKLLNFLKFSQTRIYLKQFKCDTNLDQLINFKVVYNPTY